MTNVDSFNGAVASGAGDDFHHWWVGNQLLRLLDPQDGLVSVKVEGLPEDAEHHDLGEHGQIVDLTLTFEDEGVSSYAYQQLKYSPSNPDAPWTWARLLRPKAKTRPLTSPLARLARLIKDKDFHGKVSIVTNQPLHPEVVADLALLRTKVPGTAPSITPAVLRKKLGLKADELLKFIATWDLGGFRSLVRQELEFQVTKGISQMLDADARTDATFLHRQILMLMLPEGMNASAVDREKLMIWLGAGSEETLFPAPALITPPAKLIERPEADVLVERLIRPADKPIRLHAAGGCGKTGLVTAIDSLLPDGSEVIIYDCYGGGLFLAADHRRHRSGTALVQMGNELASRLRTPFVLRKDESADPLHGFLRRVRSAADIVAARSSDALLVLVFDAVDNARIAAELWKEEYFLEDVIKVAQWPENVRIVVTGRTARLDKIGEAHRFDDMSLGNFAVEQTRALVAALQPDWDGAMGDRLHGLTGGNPRRLTYALEGLGPNDQEVAAERLSPRADVIDPLFEKRVHAAGVILGDELKAWALLGALARLPRPVPAATLAAIVDLNPADVVDVATDVGGMTEHSEGWSFHDEDFEAFVEDRTKGSATALIERSADVLLRDAATDPYASKALGEMLVAAGRYQELYDLVSAPSVSFPPGLSEVEQQHIGASRMALGLRTCRLAADVATATQLLISSAEALKRQKLIEDTIVQNIDLSARFEPEAAMRLVMTGRRHRKARAAFRVHSALAAPDKASATLHMAWWSNHVEEHDHFTLSEMIADYEVHRRFRRPDEALRHLMSWHPPRFRSEFVPAVAARLAGRDPWVFTATMSLDRWMPTVLAPLMAASLLAGLDFGDLAVRRAWHRLSEIERWPSALNRSQGMQGPLCWQEATLFVCERAMGCPDLHADIERMLLRAFPLPTIKESYDFSRLASSANWYARAWALLERLRDLLTDLKAILPEERRVSKPAETQKERSEAEGVASWNRARRRAMETLSSALNCARAVSAAYLSGEATADVPTAIAKAFAATPWDQRRDDDVMKASLLRSCLLHAILDGSDGAAIIEANKEFLESWLAIKKHLVPDIAAALALSERGQDLAGELLEKVRVFTESSSGGAGEKAKLQSRLARIALPFDEHLARHFFAAAIATTRRVDTGALAELAASSAVARSGIGGAPQERAVLALRYADAVGSVAAALGLGGDFPWSQAAAAASSIDLRAGLVVVSRWQDVGSMDFVLSIPAMLSSSAGSALTPVRRHALSRLATDAMGPLDEIYPDGTMPAALAEQEFHTRLLNGQTDYLFEPLLALEAADPGSPAARHARAVVDEITGWSEHEETSGSRRASRFASDKSSLETMDELRAATEAYARSEEGLRPYCYEELARRISRRNLRIPFLNMALEQSGSSGDFGKALCVIAEEWTDYPPLLSWAKEWLPSYIARSLHDLWEYDFTNTEVIETLLALTGMSRQQQAETITDAIAENAERLQADPLFALIGVIAARCPENERNGLLESLIGRLTAQAATAPKVPMANAAVPDDLTKAIAGFLFTALGDMDRRTAWSAAHAVVELGLADDPVVPALLELLAEDRQADPPFVVQTFYRQSAYEHLMHALRRLGVFKPASGAAFAGAVIEHLKWNPHLIVREIGRRMLRDLVESGHLKLDQAQSGWLDRLNAPRLNNAPEERVEARRSLRRDENRRFRFDDTDTIPYWYPEPCRLFDLSMSEFLDRVEHWICDEWGFDDEANRWDREPRLDRLTEKYELTSHRHGTKPTIFRLGRYLEWHGMMCALGRLVETQDMAEDREQDYHYLLGKNMPANDPLWAVDGRTLPPMESRFWGRLPFPTREGVDEASETYVWGTSVDDTVFDAETITSEGRVVVAGSFDLKCRDFNQHVLVNSALVSTGAAETLAQAIAGYRYSMDFLIPSASGRAEIDGEDLKLEGWLHFDEEVIGADAPDPRRGSVVARPVRLPRRIAKDLAASIDLATTLFGQTEELVLHNWSTEQNGSGWRLGATSDFLDRLLAGSERTLIMCVEIARRPDHIGDGWRPSTRWAMYLYETGTGLRRIRRRRRNLAVHLLKAGDLRHGATMEGRWLLQRIVELHDLIGKTESSADVAQLKGRMETAKRRLRDHLTRDVFDGFDAWMKMLNAAEAT